MQELQGFGSRKIGDIVKENYTRAAAFQEFGLDFCCGGGKTVEEACAARGIDPKEVVAAVVRADTGAQLSDDPVLRKSPAELARHIVDVHHAYVRRALPALRQFSEKVARVHGPSHPYLTELDAVVDEISQEMAGHMEEEETGIFRALEEGAAGGATTLGPDDLRGLEDDHEHVGGLMRKARALTADFAAPDGACATWRATYALLEEFEADLHRHVHLENNVLFPALTQPAA